MNDGENVFFGKNRKLSHDFSMVEALFQKGKDRVDKNAGTRDHRPVVGQSALAFDMPDSCRVTLAKLSGFFFQFSACLLYTSPSPRDRG